MRLKQFQGPFHKPKDDPEFQKRKKLSKKGYKEVTPKDASEKESIVQGYAEDYLMRLGKPFIRFPDALWNALMNNPKIPLHIKKMASNYFKGLPDLMIPQRVGEYCFLFPLELKRDKGKMSKAQLEWQEKLGTTVTRGWEETKGKIDDFYSKMEKIRIILDD